MQTAIAAKAAEIDRRAIAFDTEQLGQAVGFRHGTGTPLKAREKRVGRLYAPPVTAQKSASVAQLRGEGPEALIDRTDTPSFGRKEPAAPRPNSPPSPSPRASGERVGPRASLRAGRKFAATRKIACPIDHKAKQIK